MAAHHGHRALGHMVALTAARADDGHAAFAGHVTCLSAAAADHGAGVRAILGHVALLAAAVTLARELTRDRAIHLGVARLVAVEANTVTAAAVTAKAVAGIASIATEARIVAEPIVGIVSSIVAEATTAAEAVGGRTAVIVVPRHCRKCAATLVSVSHLECTQTCRMARCKRCEDWRSSDEHKNRPP